MGEKFWFTCVNCYGFPRQLSDCCEEEIEGNKCSNCGRFCTYHPCQECYGLGGFEVKKGDSGIVLFDITDKELTHTEIKYIKKHGVSSTSYPIYYSLEVEIKSIIPQTRHLIITRKGGRKAIKIKLEDFID